MTRRLFTPLPATQSQRICRCFVALASLLWLCCPLAGATEIETAIQSEDARQLVLDTPIEREISGSETHVYKITLATGDYLRVLVNPRPRGVKVESQLLAPGGSRDIGVYFFPTGGSERLVSLIADVSGDYRLEIRPAGDDAKAVRYEVKIAELRPATEHDRGRAAAERVESEGRILVNHPFTGSIELFRQGIRKYEEALALWRQLDEHQGELRMLSYLGAQYRLLGELPTALGYIKEASQMARTVGDRYQEANLIMGFGLINMSLGENQKALDSFRQARQLFKALSKSYGEAGALQNIGMTLFNLGEAQNALPYFEEALPTVSSMGDSDSECNILNAMGTIHRFLGDKQGGIELYKRALATARTIQSASLEGLSLRLLGDANLELGDKEEALDFYQLSLKLCRTSGQPRFEADALQRIGDVSYSLGDYQKALDYLNQSLDLFRSNWERAREANALHSLAQVNYALGNFDEALKQIEQALEIEESLRTNVISKQLRETIFASAQSSFALYIDLLMQMHSRNPTAGHERAALQASERARARSLLELLSESQADIRKGAPVVLIALERSLQQQINAKAAARTRLLSDKRTQGQAAFFDQEIAQLTARYNEVEVQIRKGSPRYAALTQPQPLNATEIQQQLDDSTVLLEFALGQKQSWLWAVTRTSINCYQLPPRSKIELSARRVYELLTAPQLKKGETENRYQTRVAAAEPEFQAESETLSQMLLGQIATKLQQDWKGKRLAVVASGALEYVPFAALPSPVAGGQPGSEQRTNEENPKSRPPAPDHRPLIAEHEIVNLPSISVLAVNRRETGGRKPAEKSIAIVADPVFEATDPRVLNALKKSAGSRVAVASLRSGGESQTVSEVQPPPANSDLRRSLLSFSLSNERGGFTRLPFSREEADAIASLSPGGSLMEATGFQANRATATSAELARYRIVHFATHGLLNSEHPELSGLVLSLVDESGKPQDGFLRMNEIYNLHLPADLIVLSACQTALGKEIKGEGLVGLTRGFMYAGAQRVVASLWQVDDLATAELMKRFYRGMVKEGLRPAQALRLAQLDMLNQKRWSSPYFWAAFTIQGEWK